MTTRIKIIAPISTEGVISSEERKAVVGPDTEIEIVNLPEAPASIENVVDEAEAAPYVIREAANAHEEEYDGVTIDCTLEPGLDAAKKVSRVPVIGAREAGFLTSLYLGNKFSVLIPTTESIAPMHSAARKLGIVDRLASVVPIGMHVLELEDQEKALEGLEKAGTQAIEMDSADIIMLGCTGMGLKICNELAKRLGVPVVEPATAALKTAEMLSHDSWKSAINV